MSGTATIHEAQLTPSKLELLAQWLPSQPWFTGDAGDLERVASFRFVDPDGEVGIETMIVRSGGVVYQVPLTYRDEALDGEDAYLVGTFDRAHLAMVSASMAGLAVAVGATAAGAPMPVGLLLVNLAPLVVVVGYELGGWHTGSQRGDGAASAP